MKIIRPDFDTLTGGTGYLSCPCGQVLQTSNIVMTHWNEGHFDYPTTEISPDDLQAIKNAVNSIRYPLFCERMYPGMTDEEYLTKKYRQFRDDFIGYLSYCDLERYRLLAALITEVTDGNDGE